MDLQITELQEIKEEQFVSKGTSSGTGTGGGGGGSAGGSSILKILTGHKRNNMARNTSTGSSRGSAPLDTAGVKQRVRSSCSNCCYL